MLDRLQGVSADAQPHAALERIAHERDADQARAELALGLVLGVAAARARHGQFARELALPCHVKLLEVLIQRKAITSAKPNEGMGTRTCARASILAPLAHRQAAAWATTGASSTIRGRG